MTSYRKTPSASLAPFSPVAPVPKGSLQRKCACGDHAPGGECDSCRKKREGNPLQRAAVSPAPLSEIPPIVNQTLSSPGKPLDAATRAFMEPRFGHDFSGVRIHTDSRAAESARAVNAMAYTVGHNVVFAANQYTPKTHHGRELLAHELAHTVQQRSAAGAPPSTDLHGIVESSAVTAGRTVARGGIASPNLPACGIGLSRAPDSRDRSDEKEIARQLQEVTERLRKPQYPGRDRDLAVQEALTTLIRMAAEEDKDNEPPATVRSPLKRDPLRPRDPRAEYGERILKQFKDEDDIRRKAEASKQAEAEKQTAEKSADDLKALRRTLNAHGFARSDIATILSEGIHPRALAILRHYGLKWSRRGPSQSDVEEALDKYEYEWRITNTGDAPTMKEWTEEDQKALEKRDILQAQLEGLSATTGSFLGAVSGGVTRLFTDDEKVIAGVAQIGATAEGALGAYAQAKGNRGSYAPQVENAPWNRYAGPTPIKPFVDPAKVGTAPVPDRIPTPDPVGENRALIVSANTPEPPMTGEPVAREIPATPPTRIRQEIKDLAASAGTDAATVRQRLDDPKLTAEEQAYLQKALLTPPRQAPTARAEIVERKIAKLGAMTDETREMLRKRENSALLDVLVENPLAADMLKLCKSPCLPEFATPEQVRRLNRILAKAGDSGLKVNRSQLREYFHEQKTVAELDDALKQVDNSLRTAERTNAPRPPTRATIRSTETTLPGGAVEIQSVGRVGDAPAARPGLEKKYPPGAEVGLPGYVRFHVEGIKSIGDELNVVYAPERFNISETARIENQIRTWKAEVDATGGELLYDFKARCRVLGQHEGVTIKQLEEITWKLERRAPGSDKIETLFEFTGRP